MNIHVLHKLVQSSVVGLRHRSCLGLVYREHGDPEQVVRLEDVPLSDQLHSDEVEVSMIAVPVNPSDINQIQGTYPIKPQFPAIGGNEGVGSVTAVGSNVSSLNVGDLVIPCVAGVGTWRANIIASSEKFIRINPSVSIPFGATVQVNPPTAYRMLKDFVKLSPGDTIIQNGSNSAVGQCVIQLSAAWGLRTINVIRSRPEQTEQDKLTDYLKELGANEVVTEEFLASHRMKELMTTYPAPQIALNCVGGKSSANLTKHLSNGGTLITYGGMSRQPVTIPTSIFIFKEIISTGYWNAKWLERNLKERRYLIDEMIQELCNLSVTGKLKPPLCEKNEFINYKHSLNVAMKPFSSVKQLLYFS